MASILNPIIVIFQVFFTLLIGYYLWVPLVAVIIFFIWQNNRKTKWVSDSETVLLLIEVPKDNDKKELSAEQMFASLHGILRPKSEIIKEGRVQEHISFEIVARDKTIQFYAWTPKHLKDFVESQIYAQYPTVQIKDGAEDYSKIGTNDRSIYGTELMLNKSEVLPLKTFTSFEVDPLAGITGVLSKLDQPGEEAWIQVLARPTDDDWQEKGKSYIEKLKGGSPSMPPEYHLLNGTFKFIGELLNAFWSVPKEAKSDGKKDEKKPEPSTGQQTMMKAVEEKITKLGYEVKIRIVYLGPDETTGRQRLQALVGGFKQFNTTNLNGFNAKKYYDSEKFVHDYQSRLFYDRGYTLNIEELASLYHLPHLSVETPNMVWTTTKTSEPPSNIPLEDVEDPASVSLFGLTNFRGNHQKFGIKRQDRGRHTYIIGQTGAGKSFLLQLLTLSDVYHNQGFAIIDPHGDFATDMMKYIPEHRLKDVVYLNPADRDFPMAFNPMEVTDEAVKDHISSELVGVLKRMFESWGPRLEYILRYTILALLDFEGATMLDITRMLNEKDFRKKVIAQIQDPVVKSFWITEFASWNEKFASEAVAPVLNKVGAFVANPLVRNIVGQQKSAFNIREIMDQGKILIVNLSRGQVGEDNAAILGALMVTKIQLAAMSRSDMDISKRRPFYLYVDEFQNFATDSFAVILSEARKYGLNLTVANQYISQMPEVVRDAVFGNVGTMISFRVGPGDSVVLGKYFEPVFEVGDLTRLNNQNIFISMIIDGEKAIPFSARTLRMPDPSDDLSDEIIKLSRENFASKRADVELDIRGRTAGPDMNDTRNPQQNNQYPGDKQPNHASTQSHHKEQEPNVAKSEFLANLKNPDAPKPHTSQNNHNRPQNNRSANNHSNQPPQGREQHRDAHNAYQSINNNTSRPNLDHVVAPADTLNK